MIQKQLALVVGIGLTLISLMALAQERLEQNLQVINENALHAHTRFLSDDLLGGRAPGSSGSLLAQRYIVSQMQLLGLRPGVGDSTYYQKFEVVEIDLPAQMPMTIAGKKDMLSLRYYDDFIAFPGVQRENIRIQDAELVFVGYGIQAPEFKWDDFKGADVRGKVLLVMNNDPDTGDPNFFGGKARLYYGRWDYKYEHAAQMGAVGAVVIHTDSSAGYPWQVVQTSWSGKQFELPSADGANAQSPGFLMKSWVTDEVAKRLVQLAGKDLERLRASAEKRSFKPVPLGVTLSTVIDAKYHKFQTANVVGELAGSDPNLRSQAVVFTAHYDHLGIGMAIAGDSIYNGALDNASGVASMLVLAQAFTQLPPDGLRRSLVLVAVDGEEAGLLGSQYFAEHSTYPPERIAANINIDGMNIWGKARDISIIGSGKSTIDEVVKEVARAAGRIVLPDQMPEQGSFYRSDQFSFAKIGVPVLYLDIGLDMIGRPLGWGKEQVERWNQIHYHQPTDEYNPNWDLSGQIDDLRLIFRIALRLANDEQMPTWLPGDEFAAIRLKSLNQTKN